MIIISARLTIYFTSPDYELCSRIHNCTYEVTGNMSKYWYDYVVNDQYRCSQYCANITNIESCPINGSECHITTAILMHCRVAGFQPLFACNGFLTFVSPMFSVAFTLYFCTYRTIFISHSLPKGRT